MVSCSTESPADSPADSPSNSLPTYPKQHRSLRGTAFKLPKPKWLWKSAHRIIPSIGRQKLDYNAMDGDSMGGNILAAY